MAAKPEPSVADWKKELISGLKKKFKEYPVVGVLNIEGIPAKQFQEIREILRGKAEIKVGRRVLLEIAINKASEEDPEIEELADYVEGPSAVIFTGMDPFRLWKLLEKNRTSAPAKTGMESPRDIVIPEGVTDFQPGPIIGELQQAGVQARIQAGEVVVLEDSKIVEEGEPISSDVVGVLSRFDIEPREIGFELRAAYEDGTVFPGDMLVVDEEETMKNVQATHTNSLNLAYEIKFPTDESLNLMLGQASSKAHNLALNASIFNSDTMPNILSEVNSEMLGLASVLASKDPESIGEELSSMLSVSASSGAEETSESKEEEEAEEEPEKETDEGSEGGEGEDTGGMAGLFD